MASQMVYCMHRSLTIEVLNDCSESPLLCREHDKGPEEFCSVLQKLLEADLKFRVSILGDHTEDIPGLGWQDKL